MSPVTMNDVTHEVSGVLFRLDTHSPWNQANDEVT